MLSVGFNTTKINVSSDNKRLQKIENLSIIRNLIQQYKKLIAKRTFWFIMENRLSLVHLRFC